MIHIITASSDSIKMVNFLGCQKEVLSKQMELVYSKESLVTLNFSIYGRMVHVFECGCVRARACMCMCVSVRACMHTCESECV